MLWLRKAWCFLVGHDMVEEARFNNGRSRLGELVCLRCGKRHVWQHDNVQ